MSMKSKAPCVASILSFFLVEKVALIGKLG